MSKKNFDTKQRSELIHECVCEFIYFIRIVHAQNENQLLILLSFIQYRKINTIRNNAMDAQSLFMENSKYFVINWINFLAGDQKLVATQLRRRIINNISGANIIIINRLIIAFNQRGCVRPNHTKPIPFMHQISHSHWFYNSILFFLSFHEPICH